MDAPKPHLWHWDKHRLGNSAIEADAQTHQRGERDQVGIKSAKYHAEYENFDEKISQEETIELSVGRMAKFIVFVEDATGREEKPNKRQRSKNPERNNER